MILVAVVTAVILELFLSGIAGWRRYSWFSRYAGWLIKKMGGKAVLNGAVGVVLVLLPILALVAVFQVALQGELLGLPSLLFSILILVYCLRYQSLDHLVDVFTDASDAAAGAGEHLEDDFRAREVAAEILHGDIPAGKERASALTEVLLVESHERLFGVLFWFVILGPFGAVLFRLTWVLDRHCPENEDGFREASHRLYGILAWLPVRLLAIAYALAGSFEDAIHDWKRDEESDPLSPESSDAVLATTGCGALAADRYIIESSGDEKHLEPEAVSAAQGLVLRSLLVWGVSLGLLTLAGWAA
jgi:membrane protein required for beta-lactamase induction